MDGQQQQQQPAAAAPGRPWWEAGVLLALAAGWILAGFFGWSLKRTTEELTSAKSSLSTAHTEAVTIREPVEVAGKVAYRETVRTVHDTTAASTDTQDRKKTVEVWRSGVALGGEVSTAGKVGATIQADLIPFGPGTVQVQALVARDEQWAGAGYRLLF